MPDDRTFSFFFDRYKTAEADIGSVYTLSGIVLTVQGGLAAGLAAIADPTLVAQATYYWHARLYLVLLLGAFVFWIASTTLLCRGAIPKHEYPNLVPLSTWLARLKQLERGGAKDDIPAASPTEGLLDEVLSRMASAEETVRRNNEERRQRLRRCIQCSIGTLALTVAAFVVQFAVAVHIHGTSGASAMVSGKDDKKIDTNNVIETRSGSNGGTVTK
jgi:hypothetical protein